MPFSDWVYAVDRDFPEAKKVTQGMVEAASRQKHKMRGSVRLMTGRISTSDELAERRRQAKQPLVPRG